MIKSLEILNFKSIKKASLEMKNFNLFCGDNASGKTTVIHSILAVIQQNTHNEDLDGELVKIGNFTEIRNKETGGSVSVNLLTTNNVSKTITLKANTNAMLQQTSILIQKPKKIDIVFEKNLFYLSSNRIGVVDTYSKSNSKFGINGEAFISFLSLNQSKQLNPKYLQVFSHMFPNEKIVNRFLDYVRFWLKYITNEDINLEQIPYTNQYVVTFGDTQDKHRPINTGSGLSYVLPIIVMCLGVMIDSQEAITIIENPEVYLHPMAQIKLTDFLVMMSKFSQIIVETHSDHVLKRVIEQMNINNEIFVFNNSNGSTTIKTLNHKDFKLHPISYSEIQYRAFDLLSTDLHIILYSTLHQKYISSQQTKHVKKGITFFDAHLNTIIGPTLIKPRSYEGKQYKTLPTYIRHCIDHPEQIDPSSNQKYEYTTEDLKRSIDFMFTLL